MPTDCHLTPGCERGRHAASDHPCGRQHIPGSPCRYCGQATPRDGAPCPDCWRPITIADIKAIAAEARLDARLTIGGSHAD